MQVPADRHCPGSSCHRSQRHYVRKLLLTYLSSKATQIILDRESRLPISVKKSLFHHILQEKQLSMPPESVSLIVNVMVCSSCCMLRPIIGDAAHCPPPPHTVIPSAILDFKGMIRRICGPGNCAFWWIFCVYLKLWVWTVSLWKEIVYIYMMILPCKCSQFLHNLFTQAFSWCRLLLLLV